MTCLDKRKSTIPQARVCVQCRVLKCEKDEVVRIAEYYKQIAEDELGYTRNLKRIDHLERENARYAALIDSLRHTTDKMIEIKDDDEIHC